ncbi:MAG: MFS transporter [Halofilum sp. (in: g-proteobacteria)]|nr:MFS transporter [Halofilum sp. (in: g-proteobacteria)]
MLTRLLIGVALLVLGHGLQSILLGVRASIEGFSEFVTGLIMSAFFVGFIIGSFIGPWLIRQSGHTRAFAAFASLASIVTLSHALFVEELVWALLRVVHGISFAIVVMVAESWLNGNSSSATRGRVLAVYSTIFLGAWAASQLLLMVADPGDFKLFSLVSILISASLIPLVLGRPEGSGDIGATRTSLRRIYAISPLGMVGAFMTGLAMNAFWTLGSVFGSEIGLAQQSIAIFMAAMLLGGTVLQWPVGYLSDLIDRRRVMVGACVLAAAMAAAIAVIEPNPYLLAVGAFLFGGVATPLYSLSISHANDHIGRDEHVAVSSALLMVYGVGAVIGPLLGGAAMDVYGPAGLPLAVAAAFGGFGLFGLWRMSVRAPVAAQDQRDFLAVAGTTHMAQDLDPRGVERSEREAKGGIESGARRSSAE